MVLTPSIIFVCIFISYPKIKEFDNKKFHLRFGSLFLEFKNNEGYFSAMYYFVYFLRRMVYLISQVYLNSYLFVQFGITIGFSIIQISYVLYYKPFKKKELLISSIIGDIACFTVVCLSTIFIQDISNQLSYILETVIVYIIIGTMVIQFIISLYSLFKSLRKMLRKIIKHRNLDFLRSFDRRADMTNVENKLPNNQNNVRTETFEKDKIISSKVLN
jgi:hypothetical protein